MGKISFKIGIFNLVIATVCMLIIMLPFGREYTPIQWLFLLPCYVLIFSLIPSLIGMILSGISIYMDAEKKKSWLGIFLNLFYIILFFSSLFKIIPI